jgi:uncharacterized membrane protein (DUF485 family)
VRFNPAALLLFVAFCGLLLFAFSTRSAGTHIAEAVVTLIILLALGGFIARTNPRSR